jgi:ribonucleoside-diphosphate reductase alpha chain
MSLISTKESKAGSLTQVVPEYQKLKNRYQLMWDQTDCIDYLKTAAVLAAYVDQGISVNTFYNPANYPERKVPVTVVAANLMQAHRWGIKGIYYSLINKQGSRVNSQQPAAVDYSSNSYTITIDIVEDEEDCLSCKL